MAAIKKPSSRYGRKRSWCKRNQKWGWQVPIGKPWGGQDFRSRKPFWQRERQLQPLYGPWV